LFFFLAPPPAPPILIINSIRKGCGGVFYFCGGRGKKEETQLPKAQSNQPEKQHCPTKTKIPAPKKTTVGGNVCPPHAPKKNSPAPLGFLEEPEKNESPHSWKTTQVETFFVCLPPFVFPFSENAAPPLCPFFAEKSCWPGGRVVWAPVCFFSHKPQSAWSQTIPPLPAPPPPHPPWGCFFTTQFTQQKRGTEGFSKKPCPPLGHFLPQNL